MNDNNQEKNEKKDVLDNWLKNAFSFGKEKSSQDEIFKTEKLAPAPIQNNSAKVELKPNVPARQQHHQQKPQPHLGSQNSSTNSSQKKNHKRFRNRNESGVAQFNKTYKKAGGGHQGKPGIGSAQLYSPQVKPAFQPPKSYSGTLRIIPIGGLDEVGKNTMIFEYEDSIFLIDLGFEFPGPDLLGVDYVIPDITYLKDKIHKIKGIIVTHGHLDHIGGIPYILPKLNFPPIYTLRLTMGLVEKQLQEFGLLNQATLRVITTDDVMQFGKMKVSFFRVTHSIPDSIGVFIETPAGNVVHTGDFKIDLSPAGGQQPPDFLKIAGYSQKNVVAMFSDSTNALKPGFTVSEKKIGETLDLVIKNTSGRIVIACFSSQIGRIQQVINSCIKYNRKIFFSGRSLIDNILMASKLGYLKFPQGLINDVRKSKKSPPEQTVILTTGSQGEPVSALSRMALGEHTHVKISKGDTVVLSSSPIPGNEMAVVKVVNNLTILGAKIINNQIMDVHASGHAQQEDLKLMFTLVQPKYLVPIHGEYFMRKGHLDLIVSQLGLEEKKGIMVENGDVLEIKNGDLRVTGEKVQTNYILVDGLGMGDIGSQVMIDRQIMAENGVIVVFMKIDKTSKALKENVGIISRGFIYMDESKEIEQGIIETAKNSYRSFAQARTEYPLEEAKLQIREAVDKYVLNKIDRQPLIIPVIEEV